MAFQLKIQCEKSGKNFPNHNFISLKNKSHTKKPRACELTVTLTSLKPSIPTHMSSATMSNIPMQIHIVEIFHIQVFACLLL